MLRLILMRHAKSDWSTPSNGDHDRPLNKRGPSAKRLDISTRFTQFSNQLASVYILPAVHSRERVVEERLVRVRSIARGVEAQARRERKAGQE